ncbi:MAG: hypothetical protein ACK4GO_10130 [Gemmobacter sp.]
MNRLFAVLAILTMAGFLGILLWHVPRLDLSIVAGVTFLLAAYDTWRSAFTRSG